MKTGLIILVFLLSGCASQSVVTKATFVRYVSGIDISSVIINDHPGVMLCFGDDNFELRNEFILHINNAIKQTEKTMPQYLNREQITAHGDEIEITAVSEYIKTMYKDYSIMGLSYAEQKECEKLEKTFASVFQEAKTMLMNK